MILIQLLQAAQGEEGVLEGFVAEEIAEEGHLLDIHLVNHLVKFPHCSPQC